MRLGTQSQNFLLTVIRLQGADSQKDLDLHYNFAFSLLAFSICSL